MDRRSPQEMITEAVAVASRADVVLAVLGESPAMSGEAASRSEIGLPECQETLLRGARENRKTARAGADEWSAIDFDLGSGALRRDSRNLVWRHRSG